MKGRIIAFLGGVAVAVSLVVLAQQVTPISQLGNASTQTGNEYVPETQSGTTVKTTTAAISAYTLGNLTATDVTDLWTGSCGTGAVLGYNHSCLTPSGCTFASPSASVGLTAITGSTGDCMDAGSAPALSQAISPTMTGNWNFTPSAASSTPALQINRGAITPNTAASLLLVDTSSGSAVDIQEIITNDTDADLQFGVTQVGASTKYVHISPSVNIPIYLGDAGGVEIYDSAGNGPYNAGYLGTPPDNSCSSGCTLSFAQRGKSVWVTAGTVTIPENVFSQGDVVTVLAFGGSIDIDPGSGLTLYWANGTSSATGNRTLSNVGVATIIFENATTAVITGSGIA